MYMCIHIYIYICIYIYIYTRIHTYYLYYAYTVYIKRTMTLVSWASKARLETAAPYNIIKCDIIMRTG